MFNSLRLKIVFAILITSLLGLGCTAVFIQQLTVGELARLRAGEEQDTFVQNALKYYALNQSWANFDAFLRRERPTTPQGGNPQELPPPRFLVIDTQQIAVNNAPPYTIGAVISAQIFQRATPIEWNNAVIGYIVDLGGSQQLDRRDQEYLQRTLQAIIYSTIGALVLSTIVGVVLAQRITKPLRDLTGAIHNLKQGTLDQQPLPIDSEDEIGELVRAFNQMTSDLANANYLRRKMTADIAHELRSPLSVMRGYIEGLRDGTLKPTTSRFDIIFQETQQLELLIDDLRVLSLADAGELSLQKDHVMAQDLLTEIERTFDHAAQQRQITLRMSAQEGLPLLYLDRARIVQVLRNLVGNALRYTPPNGEICLSASQYEQQVRFVVQDTGVGIPEDKLPYIFKRLYRADASRQQDDGQTGLGLAIAKSLVEAHGGNITAESIVQQGTTMTITLPIG